MNSLEALRADREVLTKQLRAIESAIGMLKEASGGHRRGKTRHLSAAARKKLSEAGKKRWATKRKAEAKS